MLHLVPSGPDSSKACWVGGQPAVQSLLATALALVVATSAFAQSVENPRIVEFFPSADHNITLPDGRLAVTKYLFEVYMSGASAPFQTTDMGRPAPQSDGVIRYDFSGSISSAPLPGGVYESRVAAVGPNGSSRSQLSNQFTFGTSTCGLTVSPTNASIAGSGGTRSVTITTGTGCAWSATSGAAWIALSTARGTGSGSVTLTIAANGTKSTRTATVSITGQTVAKVNVTQAAGTSPPGTLQFSATGYNAGERSGPVTVTVTRAGGTVGSVSVTVVTSAGNATADSDYVALNKTVTFGDGDATAKSVQIALADDIAYEANETFNVSLTAPTGGAALGTPAAAVVTIADDDAIGAAGGALAVDFDGDGKADPAVWRRSPGMWYALRSAAAYGRHSAWQWGGASYGDVPVPGDYDGDGKTDPVVWRPATGAWYALRSSSNYKEWSTWQWGGASYADVPVPGDYDGDGKTDPAIWRPGTGVWYALRSSSNYGEWWAWQWGASSYGDVPVPGDYDGDGKTDPAVWRQGTGVWYVLRSTMNYAAKDRLAIQWGGSQFGDAPVPGDYDGDGRTDLAIWRPSSGTWFILKSTAAYAASGFLSIQWGGAVYGDKPVPADYDGDGKTDPAVWRAGPGIWYALKSTTGYSETNYLTVQWGSERYGDLPVAR